MMTAASGSSDAQRTMSAGADRESGGLASLTVELAAATSVEQVMAAVSRCVRTWLRADGATFVLRDHDRCHYAEEDAVSPLWKGRRFPMSACISGWCMSHGEAVAIPDIYLDPRIPSDAYRPTFVRSLAMAPVGRSRPFAALGAYWAEVRQPSADEVRELQQLADAAAGALARLRGVNANDNARFPTAASFAPPRRIAALGFAALRFSLGRSLAVALACVAGATLVRWMAEATGVHGLAVFATYFPAVLLAMLFGGLRAGISAAVLGGIAAYGLFMAAPDLSRAPSLADAANLALYAVSCACMIVVVERYRRDVRRLAEEDAQHLTLAHEQRHRMKNALAVVEAIVQQSLRDEPRRARIIRERLRAGLSDVDFGASSEQPPAGLRDLLSAELGAYDLDRIALEGPDAQVAPGVARLVALGVHELATNALKYGALSGHEGGVLVRWRLESDGVTVAWEERGGPRVEPPFRRGYGMVMLHRLIQAAGGAFTIDYLAGGVRAQIALPVQVRSARRRTSASQAGQLPSRA